MSNAIIDRVLREKLSFYTKAKLNHLYDTLESLRGVVGDVVELGVALGGSALTMAHATDKTLYLYDVFGMIPSPTKDDDQKSHNRYKVIKSGKSDGVGGQKYYGYQSKLEEDVNALFDEDKKPVQTIKGDILETYNPTNPISFAHIDCDWYDGVKHSLDKTWPLLSVGGIMMVDDTQHWSGAKKAVEEFCVEHKATAVLKNELVTITKK
jgi:asparagine synthase (glutamine-hydrolysing)